MSMSVLSMVVAAGAAGCYITAEQGSQLVTEGLIVVNGNDRDPSNPNAFRAMATAAGVAKCQPKAKPTFDLDVGVPIPTIQRGNPNIVRESVYPFEKMEVGSSFHVPVTAEEQEPWKRLSSSVGAANKRFETTVTDPAGNPVMVQKTTKVTQKDAEGKPVLGADGKPVKVETVVTVAQTVPGKRFKACKVGANDPRGAGCRVFRVA